ncbi:putative Transcriptional regulatory protein, luxR family [Bradyrhizobium sp. ORS 285]|uniref:helix-turn-helix domain-containing protein n=1 Tax=Bradyrhizobium sp. ORS 285 TaxID=115808 RepID=UPI000240795F|nr:helix-turn-helix transcriptional regulator [Bradyrhizobium sp. ORS 285]CCD89063.1 putative Transcriptional regulatory protein, luxR family [Bradyrhizobium sp. ORS 285]SMX61775.1 putative Transcriptional regulatory protein, luxR family [Bradyrhizobium sp. ORS 285]
MAQLGNSLSDDRAASRPADPKVNDHGLSGHRESSLTAEDPETLALAQQLNGSLTALMLYMGEIKQRSDEIARSPGERRHVQLVVDNALQQTERVCALVSRMSGAQGQSAALPRPAALEPAPIGVAGRSGRASRSLTPREREVLKLISEGHSNKEGALRMRISPRTFESHRAEAMRKLGARNTAELVRAALLNQIG